MHQETNQRVEGGRRIRGEALDRKPLISIVTVVFRDKEELESILNNVFGFDTSDFELIVIDGGSNDGTVELLQQWNEKIDYWLSEPDSGIYDAMNKGIEAAHGEYILHLNAGDRLIYLPVKELKDACMEQIDVAAFRVSIDGERESQPMSGLMLRLRNTLDHQGTFYRSHIFPQYDLQYKVYADFDVNQRLARSGAKMKLFDRVVALHTTTGITSRIGPSEQFRVVKNNYGWAHMLAARLLKKWHTFSAERDLAKISRHCKSRPQD